MECRCCVSTAATYEALQALGPPVQAPQSTMRPSFIAQLPAAIRGVLLQGAAPASYSQGAVVIRAGEPADGYYVVMQGVAEAIGPNGEPLARFGPGESFGELALLLDSPRTATVVARSPLACLRLSSQQFKRMMGDAGQMRTIAVALATRQAEDNVRLATANGQLKRALRDLRGAYADTVLALAAAVDARDEYTGGHVERCGHLSAIIADELGLSEEEQQFVKLAGSLHDIGKVGVPDAVLRKPGPLDPSELLVMRAHPVAGEAIVAKVDHLKKVAPAVRGHHERWDGRGYPDGLAGQEIPLWARIVTVADTFDAITTDRPYRRAQDWRRAVAEIAAHRGTQFCPTVVDAFLSQARRVDLTAA
jgi:CRP-like cAMP-binding protein